MSEKTTKKRSSRKGLRIALIVLAVLLLLLLAAVIGFNTLLSRLHYEPMDGQDVMREELCQRMKGLIPEGEGPHDAGVLNVLLIGTDFTVKGTQDPGRADATMLCSLNRRTGTLKLVSFERGIMINVPGAGWDLLTHTFHYGGAAFTTTVISECFGIPIDGYVHVDCQTFIDLVDIIGGVDIELTQAEIDNMEAWDPLQEGWNHLSGYDTLQYCRLRRIDSDWQRIGRQRTAIQAILNAVKGKSLTELYSLANTILPMVNTSLSKSDITTVLLSAPRFLGKTAGQMAVPDNNDQNCNFIHENERLLAYLYG